MKFNLPAKFKMQSRDYPYVYSDNWLSNGCFAVKRTVIKDSFKYCSPLESAKIDIERLIPSCLPKKYLKTNHLVDQGKTGYVRIFKEYDTHEEVAFNDDYISHFNIDYVLGSGVEQPFISHCNNFILMACRHSSETKYINGEVRESNEKN